jgi:hypothetical protein
MATMEEILARAAKKRASAIDSARVKSARARGAYIEARSRHPGTKTEAKARAAFEAAEAKLKAVEESPSAAEPHALHFAGYDFTSGAGEGTRIERAHINTRAPGDYGADPIGDGMHRMVPSGDIVSTEERMRRLAKRAR